VGTCAFNGRSCTRTLRDGSCKTSGMEMWCLTFNGAVFTFMKGTDGQLVVTKEVMSASK
jgi:hypothetical protein